MVIEMTVVIIVAIIIIGMTMSTYSRQHTKQEKINSAIKLQELRNRARYDELALLLDNGYTPDMAEEILRDFDIYQSKLNMDDEDGLELNDSGNK